MNEQHEFSREDVQALVGPGHRGTLVGNLAYTALVWMNRARERPRPITKADPVRAPGLDVYARTCVADSLADVLSSIVEPEDLGRTKICLHCLGLAVDDYMLLPGVWAEARGAVARAAVEALGPDAAPLLGNLQGHLHLPCVEALLGRPLTLEDFTPVRANDALAWAWGRQVAPGGAR